MGLNTGSKFVFELTVFNDELTRQLNLSWFGNRGKPDFLWCAIVFFCVVTRQNRSGASMHINLVDIFDVTSTLFLNTLFINSVHILQ